MLLETSLCQKEVFKDLQNFKWPKKELIFPNMMARIIHKQGRTKDFGGPGLTGVMGPS